MFISHEAKRKVLVKMTYIYQYILVFSVEKFIKLSGELNLKSFKYTYSVNCLAGDGLQLFSDGF